MFGTSGIRGPVGDVVTARLALDVGRAVGVDTETVVVGRDARNTGDVLADAASVGLREAGTDVIRLGVVSTPTLARSVQWLGADAGVGITASHNPAPDNGIKLWNPSGQAFTPTQTDTIERRLSGGDVDDTARDADVDDPSRGADGRRSNDADGRPSTDAHGAASTDGVESAPWDAFGTERVEETIASRHLDGLVESFSDGGASPFEDLSVVVDLGNGTGRVTVDALYELGATVHTLDAQRDGRFPARKSEPNAETLTALQSAVPALDADFGIAHDGDADRMVAVSGAGEYVPGDLLLAVFARDAVESNALDDRDDGGSSSPSSSPRIAVPVDTSLVVADTVSDAGGSVEYTPVGDVHVADAASQEGFVFGGEPSGAWIWPAETLAPDGQYAALHLAALVARNGSLGALLDSVPAGAYVTRRANVEVEDKSEAMTAIERALRERYDDIDTIDGLRVDTGDGWFLVRPSGTEPLVRVTAEAREETHADDLLDSALDVVNAEGAS
ncbi:phosphohexomutase domain-containing protein [Halobellus limi]|uniref:Phosphoglucosamine mutase n=1 Tax=Halobellus limi TaxID=699433 RepID=A0A1H6CTA4_9EURY|nr:phosphoglucosamine mutase [Halobellus limi]QCC49147.1 phosphoglucosamine mutase [Halobellus limi]SEG76261.1 phosphoglucosamine mutase [Halobellus limi]